MPTLANLADQTAATSYGYGTIASGFFARASARVRGYTGQTISAATHTITGRGPLVQLPERPVNTITSVTDISDPDNTSLLTSDEYTVRAGGLLEVPAYGGNLQVVFTAGWATLPDELVELVCGVAARLAEINIAVAVGAQQETGGSESVTYGFDSYNAISELSTGEKRVLDRIFPKLAGVVVMRAGRGVPLVESQTRFEYPHG
jgi:hypothetical protein